MAHQDASRIGENQWLDIPYRRRDSERSISTPSHSVAASSSQRIKPAAPHAPSASTRKRMSTAAGGGPQRTKVRRRPPQFVAGAAVPWMRVPDDMYGPTFDRADATSWESVGRRKMLASAAAHGAPLPKLGCSLCELEPGQTMWPFHYHLGSHEALYILSGSGTMRWGYPDNQMVPVSEGDYIAIPPGPDHAHQLTNTGARTLRYLAIDSKSQPDVTVMPDSQKYGVVGSVPHVDGRARHLHTAFFDVRDARPFFDGEDDFGRAHFGHDAGPCRPSCENVYVLGGMKEVAAAAAARRTEANAASTVESPRHCAPTGSLP